MLVAACAPKPVEIKDSYFLSKTAGMEKVKTDDKHTLAYRVPGFRLGNYSKFKIEPVQIRNATEDDRELSDKDRLRLKNYLEKTVKNELIESKYNVVKSGAADVLGIRFTLSNIDSGNPYLNVLQFVSYGISYDTGGIHIETEFFDTTNNKRLAMAVIGSTGARQFNSKSVTSKWADVEQIFDDWARGFRERLDKSRNNKN